MKIEIELGPLTRAILAEWLRPKPAPKYPIMMPGDPPVIYGKPVHNPIKYKGEVSDAKIYEQVPMHPRRDLFRAACKSVGITPVSRGSRLYVPQSQEGAVIHHLRRFTKGE